MTCHSPRYLRHPLLPASLWSGAAGDMTGDTRAHWTHLGNENQLAAIIRQDPNNGWVETSDSSHCVVKKLPVDGYQFSSSGGASYTFQIRRPSMRVKHPYRVLE